MAENPTVVNVQQRQRVVETCERALTTSDQNHGG